mgnify:CR=1 FL=1
MKFKLDENLGLKEKQIFKTFGHEVYSVRDQKLEGSSDKKLFEVCSQEKCCLVTLDLDFSDVTRFPPQNSNGLVVIRPPRNYSSQILESLVLQFLESLKKMDLEKNLWIVEIGRVRIHQWESEK